MLAGESVQSPQKITHIPKFITSDNIGYRLDSSSLIGKNVYIQFVDPRSDSQIESLIMVSQEYKAGDFKVLAIIRETSLIILDRFLSKIHEIREYIHIITDNYGQLKQLFCAPACCETFYLFNSQGILITTGFTWKLFDRGTLMPFNKLRANPEYSIIESVQPGTNINDITWLGCVFKYLEDEQDYDYHLVAMFSDICIGCLNGLIIDELKKAHTKLSKSISFLIIVPDKYTDNEIVNMKTALKISIKMTRADRPLSEAWTLLIENHDEGIGKNIIFMMDNKGVVICTMNQSNYKEIFHNIYKMGLIDHKDKSNV